jgi:cytochrome c peroxidase
MKKIISLSLLTATTLILVQCNKNTSKPHASQVPALPSTAYNYALQMPPNKQLHNNTPSNNPITNDGAQLGRVLFYDTKLSINNSTSCGSCHAQNRAFADGDKTLSMGFEGKATSRNSMSIVNAVNEHSYFWDGRTASLEEMVLQPVNHSVEMGMEKMDILPLKLQQVTYYGPLFAKAFGSAEITKDKISQALAQFLRAMSSYTSRADDANIAETWGSVTGGNFTTPETNGAQLFFGKAGCANCHNSNNFRGHNDNDFANIGLDINYTDNGMGALDGNTAHDGIFMIPSLRNIALTAPYMHDGRFATLEQVIQHYNKDVKQHKNLDTRLTDSWSAGGQARKLNLTDAEVADLAAFLQTLTDDKLVNDVRFANPFLK